LNEIVEHGLTGFLVDDLTEAVLAVKNVGNLSRGAVREHVIRRFMPSRMADEYERVYRRLIERRGVADQPEPPLATHRSTASGLRLPTRRAPVPVARGTARQRTPSVPAGDETRSG
jgi:hypothetical protein